MKKGSIIDIVVWVVGAFLTILILGGLLYMFGILNTELGDIGQVAGMNMTSITEDVVGPAAQGLAIWLPRIAVIILVMSGLSILIHNFLVKAHPVFIGTYVMMTIASVIISAYVSNQYMDLLSNEVLGPTLATFGGANLIMYWLPYWTAIIGVFGFIILFIGAIRDRTGGIQV